MNYQSATKLKTIDRMLNIEFEKIEYNNENNTNVWALKDRIEHKRSILLSNIIQ